jgi:methyl-accepting chemotaxis protein
MSVSAEIDKAISAHALWKARLRLAIDTGTSEWSVRDVSPDDVCAFGKWLHSLPPDEKATERWKKVQVLHAEFHLVAAQVLKLALDRHRDQAIEAMKSRSPFASVSSRLTQTMLDWKAALSAAETEVA